MSTFASDTPTLADLTTRAIGRNDCQSGMAMPSNGAGMGATQHRLPSVMSLGRSPKHAPNGAHIAFEPMRMPADRRKEKGRPGSQLTATPHYEMATGIDVFPSDDDSDTSSAGGEQKIRVTPAIKLMPAANPLDPKRKFVCPIPHCTKSYGKSSHLRSHLTWHTGLKPFVCREPNCGKGFTRSDELNRHTRTHTGEKPFECIQCLKKFSRSDHLTKHLLTHGKRAEGTAKRAPEPDPPGPQSQPHQMPTPQLDFNDGMHFMAALLATPADSKEEAPPSVAEAPICSRNFMPIKLKLERPGNSDQYHVVPPEQPAPPQRHHQPRETLEEMVPVSAAPCPPLHGVHGQSMPDDAVMPEANAPPIPPFPGSVTQPTGACPGTRRPERCYNCSHCDKSFKRRDYLNRHVRTHTGDKPFPCSKCDKRFLRRDHLLKHMVTHSKRW